MPANPTRLYDLAAGVLAAVETTYQAEGIDLPERRYVADGPPAYDCEQVVVALVRMYPGLPFQEDPGQPVLKMRLLRSVTLAVHVVRCIPVLDNQGNPPTAAAIDASGANVLQDSWMLPWAMLEGHRQQLFAPLCDTIGMRELTPAEPSGGFGGSILLLDAQL